MKRTLYGAAVMGLTLGLASFGAQASTITGGLPCLEQNHQVMAFDPGSGGDISNIDAQIVVVVDVQSDAAVLTAGADDTAVVEIAVSDVGALPDVDLASLAIETDVDWQTGTNGMSSSTTPVAETDVATLKITGAGADALVTWVADEARGPIVIS